MPERDPSGHRQRLRERFLSGEEDSQTDGALLELLLTFAIPQRDVRPLAERLVAKYGSLDAVLAADPAALSREAGLGPSSVVLLKLVDRIRSGNRAGMENPTQPAVLQPAAQQPLFDLDTFAQAPHAESPAESAPPEKTPRTRPAGLRPRSGTGLFSNALLREAVDLLPELPDTTSLVEIRAYLAGRLHYNAVNTRERYAQYIARRMFPSGEADRALRVFARRYAGRQELRDVCFYRFCVSEPFMLNVMDELLLPEVGRGQLEREAFRGYLAIRFPGRDTRDALRAILDALLATGWVSGNGSVLTYGYRRVLPGSLAFVLHSEFPEPGMYPIAALLDRPAIRAMLWDPDSTVSALYELRNMGLIPKVSEIDDVRQFTVSYSLDEVVDRLCR